MEVNNFKALNFRLLQLCCRSLFFAILFLSSINLMAQPANDLCVNAEQIIGSDGIAFTGTTVGSTSTGVSPSCAGSGNLTESGGVWYYMESAAAVPFDINIFLCGSNSDTRLGVFTGTCDALVPLTGGDDSDKCGDDPSLIITIEPGVRYYYYVTHAGGVQDQFVININSPQPPNALCRDFSVGLGADGTGMLLAENVNNGSTADAGIQSLAITSGQTSFTCADLGNTFPVTLTVTDNSGATGTCNSTITTVDASPPTAVVIDASVTIPPGGSATITSADVVTSTSDNCPSTTPVITIEPNTFTIEDFGPNPVIVTVSDPEGPSSSYPITVDVGGNTAPVAICQDHTVELDAAGLGTCTVANIDGGSSAPLGQMFLGISSGQTDFTCADVGSAFPVELMITDDNGTSDQCTATVTVVDNLAPIVLGADVYFSVADGETLTLTANQVASISDNCGTPTATVTPNQFTPSNNGPNSVTVVATDPSGNPTTRTANVYINETNPNGPTALCQPTATYAISAEGQMVPSSFCNAGSSAPSGIASLSTSPTVGCADIGTVVPIALSVTDNNGATASCITNVTIEAGSSSFDFSGLTFSNSIFIPVGQTISTASLFSGSVTSLCGGSVNLTYNPSSFSWEDAGSLNFSSINVTATDNNGDTGNTSYFYNNINTDGPIAYCQSATIDIPGSVSVNDINNGSSAAAGIQSIVLQEGSVSFDCTDVGGTSNVTLVVTDNNGISTTCSSTVFANDPPPVVNANDVTLTINVGETVTLQGFQVGYSGFDNCESVTGPEFSKSEFTPEDAGTNFVSVCATTPNGQTGCDFISVTVNTNAPLARCNSVFVSLDEFGTASISTADVDAGSSASSGIASMFLSGSTFFGCSDVGTSPSITLNIQDNNGATATCTTSVFVNDGTPLVADIQDITIALGPSDTYTVQPSELFSNASDNCGVGTAEVTPNSFTIDNAGNNPVTLNIPSASGAPNNFAPNVYVNRPPNPNCPPAINVPVETTVVAADIAGNATADNGIASLSISPNDVMFACSDIGTASEQVTLTVTDNLGNVSTCVTTALPADITPPVIVANDITIVINQGESRTITLDDLGATFTDECSGMNTNPSFQPTLSQSTFFATAGPYNVNINAYDEAFNFATTTVIVTVEVNILPAAVCVDYTVNLDAIGKLSPRL